MSNVIDLFRNALTSRKPSGTPVPIGVNSFPMPLRSDAESQLRQMGNVSTLFSVVDLIAGDVGSVVWRLFRKGKPGAERIEVTSHAALDILAKPNSFYTGQELFEASQQHYDLVGELWWVVLRSSLAGLPLEIWPIRPDRMFPIPDPQEFISGYLYISPTGERVPLAIDQVIRLHRQNPVDPYRGMGPIQSLLADLDSVRYSAEWNRNFFINGAVPGGVIEMPDTLEDADFDRLLMRWRQSHQGVNNAHRVAVLEQGARWVDRKFTQVDMQFVELRSVSRDVIREAYRVHKHLLGQSDDVNRANALASEITHGKRVIHPRASRLRAMLNTQLLPMFGATDVEFDFDSVVPDDPDVENAERTSKSTAYKTYVDAGMAPEDARDAAGLPAAPARAGAARGYSPGQVAEVARRLYLAVGPVLSAEEARTVLADAGMPIDPAAVPVAPAVPPVPAVPAATIAVRRLRAVTDQPGIDPADVDLSRMDEEWQAAVLAVVASWGAIREAQRESLVRQVRDAIDRHDIVALTALAAPAGDGPAILARAMAQMGESGAAAVRREAAAQGIRIETVAPAVDAFEARATAVARLLAQEYEASASAEALRLAGPGTTGDTVAAGVDAHLAGLTDAGPTRDLGGALTSAQNVGRIETLRAAPQAEYYSSETLDGNTCSECRWINGKHLGSTLDEVSVEYPTGGYVRCEGRTRCRGTVVAVWRPAQVKEDGS